MGDGVWRSCPPDPNRFATSQSTLTSPILENVSHGGCGLEVVISYKIFKISEIQLKTKISKINYKVEIYFKNFQHI